MRKSAIMVFVAVVSAGILIGCVSAMAGKNDQAGQNAEPVKAQVEKSEPAQADQGPAGAVDTSKPRRDRVAISDMNGKMVLNFMLYYDEKGAPEGLIIADGDGKPFLKAFKKAVKKQGDNK